MDAEFEGVPVSATDNHTPMPEATDELRERLAKALHEAQCGCPTWVVKDLEDTQYDDMAAAIMPLVVAVVAEARTEGAIAELEYLSADTAKTLQVWTPSDLNERAAALRGVGNQNAEPRWSANRLEEVLREGLPDQNAEPEGEKN